MDSDQLKVQSKKLRGYHILEGFVQISFDLDKYKAKINFNRNLNAVKGCLFSEKISLKSSKERCHITILSTIHPSKDAQDHDLIPFFGDYSRIGKLSKIYPNLESVQYLNFRSGIQTDQKCVLLFIISLTKAKL